MTSDFSLIGESITLEIYPIINLIEPVIVDFITLDISLSTMGPELVEHPIIEDLYCNE